MNPQQVVADLCPTCKGKGFDPSGNICPYCRGIGLIGRDGSSEYYLEPDGKGGLKVSGIRGQSSQTASPNDAQPPSSTSRGAIGRSLFFIGLIIGYSAFVGAYVMFLDNQKVFWLVTLIFIGLFFLFILYDARLYNAIIRFITKTFLKEPQDFLTELQKRKKEAGMI